jgi:hypothetical protein
MTVSGSTNYALNTNEIIDKAFHRLGKASEGEAISARMYEDGRSSAEPHHQVEARHV